LYPKAESPLVSLFNLSPKQIWISQEGQPEDTFVRHIDSNSELTYTGRHYGGVLYNFRYQQAAEWEVGQRPEL
jgi:6-phosphofructo-2-kinase